MTRRSLWISLFGSGTAIGQTKINANTQIKNLLNGPSGDNWLISSITGSINSVNLIFTLTVVPRKVRVFLNGIRQTAVSEVSGSSSIADFTFSGSTITFNTASTPQAGDTLIVEYTV